jgi:hypothetical protein
MRGQKQAVVEYVKAYLPNFKLGDIALMMLTKNQLEEIKTLVGNDIYAGRVEYSKARNSVAECRAYASSMVMNHLKKAKELNGGQTYSGGSTSTKVSATKNNKVLAGINFDLLPEDLAEFVQTLV